MYKHVSRVCWHRPANAPLAKAQSQYRTTTHRHEHWKVWLIGSQQSDSPLPLIFPKVHPLPASPPKSLPHPLPSFSPQPLSLFSELPLLSQQTTWVTAVPKQLPSALLPLKLWPCLSPFLLFLNSSKSCWCWKQKKSPKVSLLHFLNILICSLKKFL